VATLDVLTFAEAQAALGGQATATPQLLESHVTAVSRRLDYEYGPIVTRTITDEAHHGGGWIIQLDNPPVSVVTTVTEYASTTAYSLTTESNTEKTTTQFAADLSNGILRRRSSNCDARWATGRKNIVVTYSAGRYASTSAVVEDFKRGAAIILRHLYTTDHGSGGELFGGEGFPAGFAIPNRAFEVIGFPRRRKLPLVG